MRKFRFHRGSLEESMATTREVTNRQELELLVDKELGFPTGGCEIKPYGYDHRTGWQTYIVTIEGYGVVGFTDGLL